MNHENNDFLRADLYKDLSGSIASSLNSILGSRKNSVILEVQPAPEAESEDSISINSESSDSHSGPEYSSEEEDQEEVEENKEFKNNSFYTESSGFLEYLPARPVMADDIEAPGPASYSVNNGKIKLLSGTLAVIVVALVVVSLSAIHKIEEGNVGVYYKNGALMDEVAFPGIHYMTPFITDVVEITIRPETDTLDSLSSITKDGIQNTFNDVQVITSIKMTKLVYMLKNYGPNFKKALVFDRIKEELRIFCANSTIDEVYNTKFLEIVEAVKMNVVDSIDRLGEGGLNLLNLVIPKPNIPNDIANNYKMVKVQWTEQLVATQQQKTEAIKKETEKQRAIADAERNKAVLEIKIQERILEKQGDANISSLNNEILKKQEENLADIEKYKILTEAEANKELFTKEYIQYNTAKNLANNTKYFFSGQDSILSGLLTKIFD